ncbi:MAG: hypothetical protein GW903_02100 [Alphaproteobacteria bacterium]|nr:hypothetical protein [Alphaproteobacteria bacterium]NCQ87763.1 hypothetical protein [Alphaproteobacteria bacterium]NCT05729.1 hypothetical protein [Alphaproteobacteria bacterium]
MNGISFKQILLFIVLATSVGCGYYYSYIYLAPAKLAAQREAGAEQGAISSMRQEMVDLQAGYDKFVDIKDEFDQIQSLGFFDDQNRLEAQNLIRIIQEQSRVISAKYSIKPLNEEQNEAAKVAGKILVATNADFIIQAVEDADIYNFVFMLTEGFPGHIDIQEFNIKKLKDVTQPLLRQIGSGDAVPLVEATMKLTWRTLKDDPQAVQGRE